MSRRRSGDSAEVNLANAAGDTARSLGKDDVEASTVGLGRMG